MKRAAIVLLAAAMACRGREAPAVVAEAPTASHPAAAASEAGPDAQRLVGRWLRSDADYTIEIASIGADGKVDARYFNPKPVHVSQAETAIKDGKLILGLELRDTNYPGNFYALMYDPGSDSLSGIYSHLGLNKQFEVAFSRVSQTP